MQYNCTAEFAVDIIPSVDTIESVNVTVTGPYGSASSLRNVNQSQCCVYIASYIIVIAVYSLVSYIRMYCI